MKPPAEDDAGRLLGYYPGIDFLLPLCGEVFHVGKLHKPDDLRSRLLEMFKISCQLQRRSVDVGLMDLDILNIDLRREIFELKFFYYTFNAYTCHMIIPFRYIFDSILSYSAESFHEKLSSDRE